MKALIVDDEIHVRKSIRLLADWQALGIDTVFEAENGMAALTLIEEQEPEIIITDIMMPLINGIELMERIRVHTSRKHKIVVVSGYNDFEFVQYAMRHGGIDYLLKPVDGQQLQSALSRAAEYCRTEMKIEEDHKLEEELTELKLLYRDKSLSEMMIKQGVPVVHESLTRALPALAHVTSCRAAVIRFNEWELGFVPPEGTDSETQLSKWIERFNAVLLDTNSGIAFKNWNKSSEIVILTWNHPASRDIWSETVRRHTVAAEEAGLHIGIGSEADFPAFINKSYNEAVQALSHRNLLKADRRIHSYSEQSPVYPNRLRFENYEEDILTALQCGNKEQIHLAVQRWFEFLNGMERISLIQIQQWLSEYRIIRERWLDNFYKEDKGTRPSSKDIPFHLPLNTAEIDLMILQTATRNDLCLLQSYFLQSRQSKQVNIMRNIAKFLQDHYTVDIPLQEISDRFYLNKEHISRRFKQEFNETITDYTNRIRIDKAKILLLNRQLKISEIAEMVGYKDEKYFSRVFKKLVKLSPNQYRNQSCDLQIKSTLSNP